MTKRFRFMERKIMFMAALLISYSMTAQEKAKFEVAAGADMVSSYVWRGMYQTGVSVQPGLTLSYGGLSLGAWGSTDFFTVAKEFDITLAFEAGGLGIGITDYWWEGEGNPYGHYTDAHFIEGTVSYSFGESLPLTLSWNTMLGLDADKNGEGKQQYSTYVGVGYDFSVGEDITLSAGIGVSPWTGIYHKAETRGFALSVVSLKAARELKITESFRLPIFVEAISAPNQDNVFLVAGISVSL
jgi:hypothetical protein